MNEGQGEVRANFTLKADNLKGEISGIKAQIQEGMKDAGKGTPLAQVNRDIEKEIATSKILKRGIGKPELVVPRVGPARGPITKGWTAKQELEKLLAAEQGVGAGDQVPPMSTWGGKSPPKLPSPEDLKRKAELDRAKFIKDATFAMMPLFNPMSVWGNLFASRQIFSAFSGTKTGSEIMGKFGLAGTGGAMLATGGVIAALTAVGLGIKALTKTIHEAIKSYESARQMYAKALMTGGLNMGFVQKRSMIASVLGVGEQDVMRFGVQWQILNEKLEWSSSILAGTNRNLTSVGWSFKIVGYDLEAMFATIANDAAPAMRTFLAGLSEFIKETTQWYNEHKRGIAISAAAALPAFGLLGMAIAKIQMMGKKAGGDKMGEAPAPYAGMKQLPASHLERMGLVIGGGIARDRQAEIAHATKATVEVLREIKAVFMGKGTRSQNNQIGGIVAGIFQAIP